MRKPLKIGELTAEIPVIQGGMGVGISLSRLAGAVASCGGVGVISSAQIGWREPDFRKKPFEANKRALAEEIRKAKEAAGGKGIVGVNIMVASQNYEEYVETAADAGVDLIISGAGLPVDLPKFVEGKNVKIAPIVSSVKAWNVIARLWERKYKRSPDLVVIEGPKAGGHLGFDREELNTFTDETYDEVIRSIIQKVKEYGKKIGKEIPVAVGGGVYDRKDMDHALELGADAVQMGTRFVTTEECDADPAYKQTYIDAKEEDIIIVQSPVGMPGRVINNSFVKRVKQEREKISFCYHCIVTCDPKTTPYCITMALIHAAEGDIENALLFCGSNACRATKIETVREIMDELK